MRGLTRTLDTFPRQQTADGKILRVTPVEVPTHGAAGDQISHLSEQQVRVDTCSKSVAIIEEALSNHVLVKHSTPILQEEVLRLDRPLVSV